MAKAPQARGTLLMVKWKQIEPHDGVFEWNAMDTNISAAITVGLEIIVMVEICKADGSATPAWLFADGVPSVNFTHNPEPSNATNPHRCPYYLDPKFQSKFARMVAAVAAHLADLPGPEKNGVVGYQHAEGITGDDRPWDGVPINRSLSINDADWKVYSRKMAMIACTSFAAAGIPVLFNIDNPGVNQSDAGWIVQHCPGAMVKQGIISHGYQLNGELDIYLQWLKSGLRTTLSRGELAVEPNPKVGTYGNWAVSPQWSLQANAEWALTFGLGIWNLYAGFLSNSTFYPTLEFFNRNAESVELANATAAFVSFRDSLDTDDIARFPEADFGAVHLPARRAATSVGKLNCSRMEAIASLFAERGARVDDIKEACSEKSVVQKKGMFLNDVCFRCWPGNYAKFMTQLNASSTSVGYWRVGSIDEPYGRFARGLDQRSGKDTIRLKLQEGFAASHRDSGGRLRTMLRVVYFDGYGTDLWTLTYNQTAAGDRAVAMHVQCTGMGLWKEAVATVTFAPAGVGGIDFELRSLNRSDTIFSLVEVVVL